MEPILKLFKTTEEIQSSHAVMNELRPAVSAEAYVPLVNELSEIANYQLLGVEVNQQIEAVAGFRISKSLAWGKYLYIDDLVTANRFRSSGHGKRMMDWLMDYAKTQGCQRLDLDSGVQRFGAHRFYLRERMDIQCYHFVVGL